MATPANNLVSSRRFRSGTPDNRENLCNDEFSITAKRILYKNAEKMHFLAQKFAGIGIFRAFLWRNLYFFADNLTAQDHYKALLDYFQVKY